MFYGLNGIYLLPNSQEQKDFAYVVYVCTESGARSSGLDSHSAKY